MRSLAVLRQTVKPATTAMPFHVKQRTLKQLRVKPRLGQGAQLAALDTYAFGVALAERGIPRQYSMTEAMEDVVHARR